MHPVPLRSVAFWGGADTAFRTVSGTHLPEAQPLFYSSLLKPLSELQPTLAGHVPRGLLTNGRRPRCPRCVSFLLGCHRVFPGVAVDLPDSPRPLSPTPPPPSGCFQPLTTCAAREHRRTVRPPCTSASCCTLLPLFNHQLFENNTLFYFS